MTTLETTRLLLRPIANTDIDTIVRELNNYEIAKNTARIPQPYTDADAQDFINWTRSLTDGRSLICAVARLAEPGILKGVISYEWSEAKGDAEIGYWYAPDMWNQGHGKEAARAIVEHAFVTAAHDRLVSCYHDGNEPSRRILESVGFEVTGKCTGFSKAQNRDVPLTNMTLTRQRWQEKSRAK